MIIYSNVNGDREAFEEIIKNITTQLNQYAIERPDYYKARSGTKLEKDVFEMLKQESIGTSFEGTIRRASRQRFPDIIAKRYFGVEVKTTKNRSWTSTGSSIVESTREEGVERIYLLFGKLSDPVGFKTKPYEHCLSDIVVTHSPRYRIDMELDDNETVFEKMDVVYDEFRNNENSIDIVKSYYRNNLRPGQNLWWIDSEPIDEQAVSPIVKMWNTLDIKEKRDLKIQGYCWFPEIFGNSNSKYNRLALWLVTQKGIVITSLRDVYTAGGRMNIETSNKIWKSQPQIFYKMTELKDEIVEEISTASSGWIQEFWKEDSRNLDERIKLWIDLIVENVSEEKKETKNMLYDIFELYRDI